LRLKLCEGLASQLLDPAAGDVAIEVFNKETGKQERLYALKHVLSIQSDFFSTSNVQDCYTLIQQGLVLCGIVRQYPLELQTKSST
jgi:hypothetical protein